MTCPSKAADPPTRPRVLIVDDEPTVLKVLARGLANEFDVSVASDGVEALEILEKRGPFAALLSDFEMPKMNGLALLTAALGVAPTTRRVLCTGTHDQGSVLELAMSAGLFGVVYKPTAVASIRSALREAVQAYELEAGDGAAGRGEPST